MTTTTKTKTPRVFIHSYNMASASANALCEALGARKILDGGRSRFRARPTDIVINWGSSTDFTPEALNGGEPTAMLNMPANVSTATNKLTFFQRLTDAGLSDILVPWTADKDQAEAWQDEGRTVVVRNVLNGHSAQGLEICDKDVDIPDAPLYTMYIPKGAKAGEYRVHVFDGKVIRLQKKILRPELTARIRDENDEFSRDDVDWKVRNHDNGFVYVTEGVEDDCPKAVTDAAIKAVRRSKLDFGAVDVIYNNRRESAFVLEVNTSPGLTGETLTAYVEAIKGVIKTGFKVNRLDDNPYAAFDFERGRLYYLDRDELIELVRCRADGIPCFGETVGWTRTNHALYEAGLPEINFERVENRRPSLPLELHEQQFYQAYLEHLNNLDNF